MIELGPFRLVETIGAGGMGEIWRAEHVDNGVPVAIKAIRSAASDEFRDAFLHEVRLVAGLSHRNVILALDAGTVPASAEEASEGRLVAGAPYLAMELAGGGSMASVRIRRWDQLKHVLHELLQALAHAHARGVVHRDIKPGNLLLAAERTEVAGVPKTLQGARIVLTDFGIGSSRDAAEMFGDDAIGTPEYMAPEQVRGMWRDQGPWTDLYAAGILAFKIACGRSPFKRRSSTKTMIAHLREPVPPVEALFDVPAGFEGFVRRLLAKSPEERFQYAGDAKRALLALEDVAEESEQGATRRMPAIRDVAPLSTAPRRQRFEPPAGDDEAPTERNTAHNEISLITGNFGSSTGTGTGHGTWSPKAWSDANRQDFRLAGAGLGLYGLRTIPLVDRVAERDRLWGSLVRVRTAGEAAVVVLRGPSGTGKSRLAEWLAQTAHEAGAGRTLKAAMRGGSGDVHSRLAEAGLRCEGLSRIEVLERVHDFLGSAAIDGAADTLAQVVAPWQQEGTPLSLAEKNAAMELFLRRFARDRTVLVWLDDAHLSLDAIALARRMLRVQEPVPALVVLTIEEEALAERPEAKEALEKLLTHEQCEELLVGPLGRDDHTELVRGLLGLEGSVAKQVEQRTAGNPLFAVQLVGDWISRGLLRPSERGFRLSEGADAELPQDLLAVWEQRIESFLEDRTEADAQALELGATLGIELTPVDFRLCCRQAGIAPSLDLVGEVMSRGLARPVDDQGRWTLVHGMVREVLTRRARTHGRWKSHNLACATFLQRAGGETDPERLARHLLAAEEREQALEPLNRAISVNLAAGDSRSSVLIQELENALKALDLPQTDPRWGELWLSWAWLFRLRGDLAKAERWAVRSERASRRNGWDLLQARALRMGARIERNLGHVDEAMAMIEEAHGIFQAQGDRSRAAACRQLMGDIWWQRSDLNQAEKAYRSVLGATDDPQDEVEAWMGLANIARRRNETDRFTQALENVRQAAIRAGRRNALAAIANQQGELARQLGDLAAAEEFYREATRRYKALDDANYVYSQLNVGLLQVLRGSYREAIALIEPLRAREERGGVQSVAACFARAVLLPCVAGTSDWSAFKDHYKWLKRYLADRDLYDGDLARMASLAARIAEERGRPDGAIAATRIALGQYRGLKDHSAAREAEGELARLQR